jgi:lipopolysaccharide export system protein LptA
MKALIATCSAVLVLALVATAAAAEGGAVKSVQGSDQPINVKSSKVVTRTVPGGGEIAFSGNVKVEQDDMKMTCDRLVVVYQQDKNAKGAKNGASRTLRGLADPGELNSITASGHVKIVQKNRVATAGKAFYDRTKGTVALTESPHVREDQNQLEADTIVIYLAGKGSGDLNGTGGLKSISAVGHVKMVQKEQDQSATAGKAIYDHVKQTVTLSDSPRLRQGGSTLGGETITLNLRTNAADIQGGKGGGITAIINPGALKKEMEK